MELVPLSEITIDPAINVRAGLDEERVEYLRDVLDRTPPITVFKTPDGILLADGFHRVAAATREGRRSIRAEFRTGSRKDALIHAATANATHGTPLTRQDFGRAVVRLHEVDPSASPGQIAEMLGGAKAATVSYWLTAERTRSALGMPELPTQHAYEIAKAPAEDQRQLAERAVAEGWHSRETRAAAGALTSPSVPEEYKADIRSGRGMPLAFRDGEPRILPETHSRLSRDAKHDDRVADLFRLVSLILGMQVDAVVLDKTTSEERRRLASDLQAAAVKLDRLAKNLGSMGDVI